MVVHSIKQGNDKLTLSINKEILQGYKKICNAKGLVISKQIENFMKDEIKK